MVQDVSVCVHNQYVALWLQKQKVDGAFLPQLLQVLIILIGTVGFGVFMTPSFYCLVLLYQK